MIELEDCVGKKFAEGDHVIFADSHMSLRIAKVRGFKPAGAHTHMIALDIVEGMDIVRKRYSRRYNRHDFYKLEDYEPELDNDE